MLIIDATSIRYILNPPHFESNLEVLQDTLQGTRYLNKISLNGFKSKLERHAARREGPRIFNSFGFPVYGKSEDEKSKIDKMNTGFCLMIDTDDNCDKQSLFDHSFDVERYDFLCSM